MKWLGIILPFFLDKWRSICYKNKQNLAVFLGVLIVPLLLQFPSHFELNTAPMLTITVSHKASHAIQYHKSGLSKEGNYYQDKQIKAYWAGKTSQLLGIKGKEVTEENFERLVKRLHPEIEGMKLGIRYSGEERAGVDLTFSAPKCVTLLHSLTKNPEILEIHRRSYQAAMLEAEQTMYTQSNSKYARGYTHTGNLIYAAFDHFLSRPMDVEFQNEILQIADPQLHTHCFIPNATWNEKTGRYHALEIYNLHKNSDFLRTVYHNHLALELEAAGFQTERDGNFIKLTRVSREQIERFSLRSKHINKIAAERGYSPQQKGELGKLTRKAKSKISLDDKELYEHWLARVSEQELKELHELKGKKFDRLPRPNVKQVVDRALEHAFERNSVENIKKVIAYGAKFGYSHLTIDQVTKELQSRDNIIKSEKDTIEYITTRELVQEENRMIGMATSGKGKFPPQDLSIFPIPEHFNDQQRKACQEQLQSYDQTTILRGAPGTGKSTIFSYFNGLYQKLGMSLTAVAPSTQASLSLAEKGLESNTISGLLNNPKAQEKLRGNVMLVDEAGMIGVKNMSALLELGNKYQSRIILCGDTKQMGPPSQYGDALAILEKQSRLTISTIDEIMRQRHAPEYQSAVTDIYKGRILEGYQKLNKQGHVREIPEYEDRIKKIAKDYVNSLVMKKSTLIVSPTHYEADLINTAVREVKKSKKLIQGAEKTFETLRDISLTNAEKKDLLSYQKGQVVRFTKNQKGGYKAGSHHEVIDVTKDQNVLVRDLKTGAVSNLPYQNPDHFGIHSKQSIGLSMGDKIRLTNNATSIEGSRMANGTTYEVTGFNRRGVKLSNGKTVAHDFYHFRYGYTDTSFSSQGKDAHTTLLSLSDLSQGGINEKSFLVGVSRGTKEVKIYTSDKEFLKKSIMRSADRFSAREIVEDHQQRLLKRQQRSYQKDLQQKMKTHERVQRREKASSRGLSKDDHTR